ncbi:MAG: sugar phosphate isomerase/epimerase [Clostridia bacterium]|nr:sugar phosphate isomerase/epimerase [Clostridia bacterium]
MKLSMQSGDLPLQFGVQRGYALIREAGFEGIDWSLDHAIHPSKIRNLEYKGSCLFERSLDELLEYYEPSLKAIRENELSICLAHSFFPSYTDGHEELIDWSVQMHMRGIEFCEVTGVPYFVIHGIAADSKSGERLNTRLYGPLAEFLRDRKTVVCLENLFVNVDGHMREGHCGDPSEAVQTIDRLNAIAGRKAFALCLDTGHLNLYGKDAVRYVETVGSRIAALHIHDNPGFADWHMAPLTGSFHWKEWTDAMRAIGYNGDLSFETFAQTNRVYDLDPDLVLPWLTMIRKTGESIRKLIAGE